MAPKAEPPAQANDAPARIARWRAPLPNPDSVTERIRLVRWDAVLIWIGLLAMWGLYVFLMSVTRHLTAVTNIPITVTAAAIAASKRRMGSRRLHALLDFPAAFPQYPVRIELFENNRRYAIDFGIVTFVEGSLHYQGLTTEFDVPIGSCWTRSSLPKNKRGVHSGAKAHSSIVKWTGKESTIELRLLPQEGIPDTEKHMDRAFRKAFEQWQSTPPKKGGFALYPPIDPQPAYALRARRIAVLWELIACLSTIAFGMVIWHFRANSTQAAVIAAVPLAMLWLATINFSAASRELDGVKDLPLKSREQITPMKLARGIISPRTWWVPLRSVFQGSRSQSQAREHLLPPPQIAPFQEPLIPESPIQNRF